MGLRAGRVWQYRAKGRKAQKNLRSQLLHPFAVHAAIPQVCPLRSHPAPRFQGGIQAPGAAYLPHPDVVPGTQGEDRHPRLQESLAVFDRLPGHAGGQPRQLVDDIPPAWQLAYVHGASARWPGIGGRARDSRARPRPIASGLPGAIPAHEPLRDSLRLHAQAERRSAVFVIRS